MIKNPNHLPVAGRTYIYLGAKACIVWAHKWSETLLVDIKYDGAREVTHFVKWCPTLFKQLPILKTLPDPAE